MASKKISQKYPQYNLPSHYNIQSQQQIPFSYSSSSALSAYASNAQSNVKNYNEDAYKGRTSSNQNSHQTFNFQKTNTTDDYQMYNYNQYFKQKAKIYGTSQQNKNQQVSNNNFITVKQSYQQPIYESKIQQVRPNNIPNTASQNNLQQNRQIYYSPQKKQQVKLQQKNIQSQSSTNIYQKKLNHISTPVSFQVATSPTSNQIQSNSIVYKQVTHLPVQNSSTIHNVQHYPPVQHSTHATQPTIHHIIPSHTQPPIQHNLQPTVIMQPYNIHNHHEQPARLNARANQYIVHHSSVINSNQCHSNECRRRQQQLRVVKLKMNQVTKKQREQWQQNNFLREQTKRLRTLVSQLEQREKQLSNHNQQIRRNMAIQIQRYKQSTIQQVGLLLQRYTLQINKK